MPGMTMTGMVEGITYAMYFLMTAGPIVVGIIFFLSNYIFTFCFGNDTGLAYPSYQYIQNYFTAEQNRF